jgi:hypothetical protein
VIIRNAAPIRARSSWRWSMTKRRLSASCKGLNCAGGGNPAYETHLRTAASRCKAGWSG